nr:enolase C-terminal domain-like protein [Verminephrobacter aporrectodeae]
MADANCGWRLNDALIAARAMEGLPRLYLEQPCPAHGGMHRGPQAQHPSHGVRRGRQRRPDADSRGSRGGRWRKNLKVSKVGGLTRAKLMRDLCQELGVQVTIEDTWGGDVVSAASAHLAASTRARSLLTVSFMNDWTREHVAGYQPRSQDGSGSAPTGPGLGIDVDPSRLAAPLFSAGA